MPRRLWVVGWYEPDYAKWTHTTFARKCDAEARMDREYLRLRMDGDDHPSVEMESFIPANLPFWAPRPVLGPGVLYADQQKGEGDIS